MSPERIQLKRTKGWRMPPGTVKVTRPGPWGNPFVVGRDGTAEDCVAKFAASILPYRHGGSLTDYLISEVTLEEIQRDLGGKDLACWCREGDPCHADVLLRLANPGLPRPHPQEDKP